jgi:hypothetical protein
LRHLRDRAAAGAGPRLGEVLAEVFVEATVPLTRAVGLLHPGVVGEPAHPAREHTVIGDGTMFKTLSGVTIDPATGEVRGSRARCRPRVAEQFVGKSGKPADLGIPAVFCAVRGDDRRHRVILGLGLHTDHDEIAGSMRVFGMIHRRYGASIHAFVYDRLMSGRPQQDLMRLGVVPVVDMRTTDKRHGVQIPYARMAELGLKHRLEELRSRNAHLYAQVSPIETVTHHTAAGPCAHRLHALAGTLVCLGPHELSPTWDSHPLEQTDLWFDHSHPHKSLWARYEVPCAHGSFPYDIEISGDRHGSGGDLRAMVDLVRPIATRQWRDLMRGYRQDIESTFETLKQRCYRHGRACSLHPDDFLVDLVGAALHNNAVTWDVYAAQHTVSGQLCAETLARCVNRAEVAKVIGR